MNSKMANRYHSLTPASVTVSNRRDFLKYTYQLSIGAGLACETHQACGNSARTAQFSQIDQLGHRRRVKHVIMVCLNGAPSQLDTLDPKPDSAIDIRGETQSIATSVIGIKISASLPMLAERMHLATLVRSLHHTGPATHEAGLKLQTTGRYVPESNVPLHWAGNLSHVQLNATVADRQTIIESQSCDTQALHLTSRTARCRSRDQERYGHHDLGRSCLKAHQLIEAGASVVTINQFSELYGTKTWDMHTNGGALNSSVRDYRETLCPQLDQAISALLDDLRDKGLFEETILYVGGEMGRTPRLNRHGGRDHHTGVWSVLLAGGPISRGNLYGSSDREAELPKDDPITPSDICRFLQFNLGITSSSPIEL